MNFASLEEWLAWQERLNPATIDLGLERVQAVWARLKPAHFAECWVISVAGTNGKGSTVALLEAMLNAAGRSTCAYTSPHLWHYNERIRLNGQNASDAQIMQAFQAIEAQRADVPLTYFEYGTLAALYLAAHCKAEVLLLEVGLGGRLDAVNIVDADIALITSIGLDHQAWLGNDLESIAREKAGIMRAGRPVIYGAVQRPSSIDEQARAVGAELYARGRDFELEYWPQHALWHWQGPKQRWANLPEPALPGRHQLDNAAAVLMALSLLPSALAVPEAAIRQGLGAAYLPGRQQRLHNAGVEWLLDVAHNPHAASRLAESLQAHPPRGRSLALLAVLQDKDAQGIQQALACCIEEWHLAGLDVPRGLAVHDLHARLRLAEPTAVYCHERVDLAIAKLQRSAKPGDRVVVLGSFHTVAQAWMALQRG